MTNAVQRLLRNGSVYTFASAASTATALIVTPILTRLLGIVEYDEVAIAVVVLNISISFLSLGLPTSIIRAVHARQDGTMASRRIVVMGAGIVAVISVLTVSTAVIIGLTQGITFALIAGGAGGAVAMVLAYFVATEQPLYYVVFSFGLSLGGPVVGLLSALLLGANAETYLMGLAAANVLVALCGISLVARLGVSHFTKRELSSSLAIGLPMIPHQLAVGAASGAAILTATLLLPTGAAAHTQIALLIGSAPLAIVSALGSAWTPVILSAPIESRGTRLAETAGLIAFIAALGGGALAMLGPWFVQLIAPAEEFDADLMIPLVATTSIAAALSVAYTSHLQLVIASGKTKLLILLSPLALALGFGTGLALVPRIGIVGAAIGFVAVYVFFILFTRSLARRVSTVRWSESKLWSAIALAIALGIGGAELPWESAFFTSVRGAIAAMLLAIALWVFLRTIRSRGLDS